jgi:integral membrane protein
MLQDRMTDDRAAAIERSQLRSLEMMSIVEATTLVVLLLIAVPLKHVGGWDWGVRIIGPAHGLAFLAYVWTAVQTVAGGGWRRSEIVRLFVVAFIPFGGYFNLPFLFRKDAELGAGRSAA